MPPKKSPPNPCQKKGRYCGGRSSGRFYRFGTTQVAIPACECASPFRAQGGWDNQGTIIRYGMDKDSGRPAAMNGRTAPENSVLIVPCREMFLESASEGTKTYRKSAAGKDSKFRGCQEVETWLTDRRLVVHESAEDLGKRNDVLEWVLANETPDGIRPYDFHDVLPGEGAPPVFQDLGDFIAGSEHSVKMKTAYRAFLKCLTPKQRAAIETHYGKSGEKRLTQKEAAQKLGIGLDSFRQHLELARKKGEKVFLRHGYWWKPKRGFNKPKKKEKQPQVIQPVTHILKTGERRVFEVKPDGPRPFGEIRERSGIDRQAVKDAIRREHFPLTIW